MDNDTKIKFTVVNNVILSDTSYVSSRSLELLESYTSGTNYPDSSTYTYVEY